MIQLNYRDTKPIYEQIRDGIRQLLVSGVLAEDEKLPSIRELATKLAINPNTIQKAYRALEKEGYIYTISGKGSFAALKTDVVCHRVEELEKAFDHEVKELLCLSVPADRLKERIEELKGELADDQGK